MTPKLSERSRWSISRHMSRQPKFLFAASVGGDGDLEHATRSVLARLSAECQVRVLRGESWLAAEQSQRGSSCITSCDPWIAVGSIRLDHPTDVLACLKEAGTGIKDDASELELAAYAVGALGKGFVRRLLGDFGFLVFDTRERSLVAARDAFGVRPLFYAQRSGVLLVASRADLLSVRDDYDEVYLAHFLLWHSIAGPWTAYSDVQRLPHAHVLDARHGTIEVRRYWFPTDETRVMESVRDAPEQFLSLFRTAIRSRLPSSEPAWCELSGGLDTSSVVVTAGKLASEGQVRPLAGVISYVDSQGDGDERPFVDAVVAHTGIRAGRVCDDWAWRDDGVPPPLTDEPAPHYPFFARQRSLHSIVRAAGAAVLLTGQGSDQYLEASPDYITDELIHGQVGSAWRDAMMIALSYHCSVWRVLECYGVVPFLPHWLRVALASKNLRAPDWLDRNFVRRHDLKRLRCYSREPIPRKLSRLRVQFHKQLDALSDIFSGELTCSDLELRHPFLYRPLVEFSLNLSPTAIMHDGKNKFVLREAMRGLLPESVRQRRTKGSVVTRVAWSLTKERDRLDMLLKEPLLADLGCVDARQLRRAVELARCGALPNIALLSSTLALETWLAVRAGRWDAQPRKGVQTERTHLSAATIC